MVRIVAGHYAPRRAVCLFVILAVSLLADSPVQAESIISCPRGMQYQSAACYSVCPEGYEQEGVYCRASCSDGYSYNSLTGQCLKGFFSGFYTPDRRQRQMAYPSVCESTSFTRTVDTSGDPETFTLIVASDPQLPWGGPSDSKEAVLAFGKKTNHEQVQAMNGIEQASHRVNGEFISGRWPTDFWLTRGGGEVISRPLGVIMNGDLTAYWHPWQVDLYKQYYHTSDTDVPGAANLKLKLFPGLGNHDYANNLYRKDQGCWWNRNLEYMSFGYNGCAKNATHYIKTMVSCGGVPNFESRRVSSYDEASLAYSFEIGQYHFVQLNNHPAFTADEVGVTDAFEWLRRDLARAAQNNRYIVINFHDYGDHMSIFNQQFSDLMVAYKSHIVALFAGHLHAAGYKGLVPLTKIPIYLGGSSEFNDFLLVQFGKDYMNVGVMSSKGGEPRFPDYSHPDNLKTWLFSDILE